uniref:Uncharacterized protein n=1 Tax=Cyprinus carpio carpio TaxID=630221 RepID=A0A9J7XNB3_CYPCA
RGGRISTIAKDIERVSQPQYPAPLQHASQSVQNQSRRSPALCCKTLLYQFKRVKQLNVERTPEKTSKQRLDSINQAEDHKRKKEMEQLKCLYQAQTETLEAQVVSLKKVGFNQMLSLKPFFFFLTESDYTKIHFYNGYTD